MWSFGLFAKQDWAGMDKRFIAKGTSTEQLQDDGGHTHSDGGDCVEPSGVKSA